MIDTHCHLTFPEYRGHTCAVLDAAAQAGVTGAITVSTTSSDAEAALRLATSDPRLWCTAGVHPLHSDEPVDWDALRQVAAHPRCVAWGELGLDNHYSTPPREVQRRVLAETLGHIAAWAAPGGAPEVAGGAIAKPIVVHCREAFADLIPRLAESGLPRERFVFHCFTGSVAEARQVLDFGAWLSFTGVVTFRNAPEVSEAARMAPLDRIMAETDSPFLSPEPVRTMRPNAPANVGHVYRRIAELRGGNPDAVIAALTANARRFYGLGEK